MSEKTAKSEQEKSAKTSISKWLLIVFVALIMEAGAVLLSAKFIDFRASKTASPFQDIASSVSKNQKQIQELSFLPQNITQNTQRIADNKAQLNLISQDLKSLQARLENEYIISIEQKINALSERIEALEELKNDEVLVLNLALFIKENALSHRPFSYEVEMLSNIAQSQENLTSAINQLNKLKETVIYTDQELLKEYEEVIKNFSFKDEKSENNVTPQENDTILSKGLHYVKNKVSDINFDKIIVVNGHKMTTSEKQLIKELSSLVAQYKYSEVLNFLNNNPVFLENSNQMVEWKEKVVNNLSFNEAISFIVASEVDQNRKNIQKTQESAE